MSARACSKACSRSTVPTLDENSIFVFNRPARPLATNFHRRVVEVCLGLVGSEIDTPPERRISRNARAARVLSI